MNRNWISNKKFLLRDFRETLEWTVHKFLPTNWLLNEHPLSFKFQFLCCDAFCAGEKRNSFLISISLLLLYYFVWDSDWKLCVESLLWGVELKDGEVFFVSWEEVEERKLKVLLRSWRVYWVFSELYVTSEVFA